MIIFLSDKKTFVIIQQIYATVFEDNDIVSLEKCTMISLQRQ